MKLFHVSEEKHITEFTPRYSDRTKQAVVWAIAEAKLVNYLLPRNCPRVCFSAGKNTLAKDRHRFLGASKQAIAIESLWYNQARSTTLYLYEMPDLVFQLFDLVAGYYVTNSVVVPKRQCEIDRPLEEILCRDVELRILPSLWQLHDEVSNSTLDFSIIRMNNARSRITDKVNSKT